jgi:cell shape-determining protein MreD
MFGLAVVQIAFIGSLPFFLNALNAIIIALVWLISLREFRVVVWWSAGLGFILDLYSFLPFGLHLFSLLASVFLARWLLLNFFTNRSLYSYLALTFFAILAYEICRQTIAAVFYAIISQQTAMNLNINFWISEAYILGLNMAGVVAVFYAQNYISQKLRPVFLFKIK